MEQAEFIAGANEYYRTEVMKEVRWFSEMPHKPPRLQQRHFTQHIVHGKTVDTSEEWIDVPTVYGAYK